MQTGPKACPLVVVAASYYRLPVVLNRCLVLRARNFELACTITPRVFLVFPTTLKVVVRFPDLVPPRLMADTDGLPAGVLRIVLERLSCTTGNAFSPKGRFGICRLHKGRARNSHSHEHCVGGFGHLTIHELLHGQSPSCSGCPPNNRADCNYCNRFMSPRWHKRPSLHISKTGQFRSDIVRARQFGRELTKSFPAVSQILSEALNPMPDVSEEIKAQVDRKLFELRKNRTWLAGELGISTTTVYRFFSNPNCSAHTYRQIEIFLEDNYDDAAESDENYVPVSSESLGLYSTSIETDIPGVYAGYYKSFFKRGTVIRFILHIFADEEECKFVFREYNMYDNKLPASIDDYRHSGDVHIGRQNNSIFHCVTIAEGHVRLLTLTRGNPATRQLVNGMMLTQTNPGGSLMPACCIVVLEKLNISIETAILDMGPGRIDLSGSGYTHIIDAIETAEKSQLLHV